MSDVYIPTIVVDRESDVPLYEQIANPIEAEILSGNLAPGQLIEDEVSMATRLKVARPTARRALQELTSKGLVTRRRGVGTRVTPRYVHRPMKLSSLNEDLISAGFTPTTKVLTYEVREASEEEAEQLDVSTGEGVLAITRLRHVDDRPLALMKNLIPLDMAPGWQELNEQGLYQCLRRRGIEVLSATQAIGAREATEEEAELLEEAPGSPLLTMHRIGRTSDDRVAEVGDHLYRPSLYSFRFSMFTP